MNPSNRVRSERTRSELDAFEVEFAAWLQHWRSREQRGRYTTLLNVLETTFSGAARHLATALETLSLADPPYTFYVACRRFDQRVLCLQRIWRYFREKFDQRLEPAAGPSPAPVTGLLAAADDVVWSCYKPVFELRTQLAPLADPALRRAGLEAPRGPAPVPYLEYQYSPEAFPDKNIPDDLKLGLDEGLLTYLNRLPIPLVRLPAACTRAPWWLVYLGHEVGHQVQYDLLSDFGLVSLFAERIEQAVAGQGATDDEVVTWGQWAGEIFADAFSILMMGPGAVRAMVELELQSPAGMCAPRPTYPPAAVRLELMARTAERVGLDGRGALVGLDPAALVAGNARATRDLAMADAVVEASLAPLPGIGLSLPQLCALDPDAFGPDGDVASWARVLLGQEQRNDEQDPHTARHLAAAAFTAWLEIGQEENAVTRRQRYQSLRKQVIERLPRSGEPGMRSADREPVVKAAGDELGALLLRLM